MKKSIINYQFQKGFTLVEILLYLGLFTILLLIFVQVFTSLINTQLESETRSGIAEDSQYILTRLTYDITRASAIVSPALGASSSALSLTINGSTVAYAASGSSLMLGSDAINSYATTVSNFSATHLSNTDKTLDSIEVSFTLTSTATQPEQGPRSETFQTTINRRVR